MDRLKGSKMEKKKIYIYIYIYHAKTTGQKQSETEVHFTFFSLYSSKLKEAPSWQLNEKKAVMS